MSEATPMQMTLVVGEEFDEDLESSWCNVNVKVTLMANRKAAGELAMRLLQFALETDTSDDDEACELGLTGYAYMAGRLPPKSTYLKDRTRAPGIVVVDDVHGWDFPERGS